MAFRPRRSKRIGVKFAELLKEAMHENNVEKFRKFLNQGVDPNFAVGNSFLWEAVHREKIEMAKLLIEHGARVTSDTVTCIMGYGYTTPVRNLELLPHVIKYNRDIEILEDIFLNLTEKNTRISPSTRDNIFDLLVDHGLPVDGTDYETLIVRKPSDRFREGHVITDWFTALHLCIRHQNLALVRKLSIFN